MKISIVTATLNCASNLAKLINSLENQTNKNFEWIVADGGSVDETLLMLNNVKDINLKISVKQDFGIYDAMNRALKLVESDYYIVIGADDYLYEDAIENYIEFACEFPNYDIYAAGVLAGKKILMPNTGMGWLYGMAGISSCHSVGLMIKRDLHDKFGFYSNKLPITADQLFIKSCLYSGGSIVRKDFVAGVYGISGMSSRDDWGMITELLRVQLATEKMPLTQLLLFNLRFLKTYLKKLFYKIN